MSDRGDGPTQVVYSAGRRPLLVAQQAMVRVVSGPDEGSTLELGRDPVVAGAGDACQLTLSDPLVSGRHVELRAHPDGYLVCDLESTNGTFYRGARLQRAVVGPGAELRLGKTVLRIERGEEITSSIPPQTGFGSLVGTSRAMQDVFGLLAAVAPTETTVLILGETGTGKELVAEELHGNSPRGAGPFSVLDCGAVPEQLIESELFGHRRGAFTGANSDRLGIFEQAAGGTVFLDEIGELPLAQQTRLLRVLEQRSIKRLGENTRRDVDVRIVAATNRDLLEHSKSGKFREDLFYRLSVVQVRLPALRERREDIPLLARFFLKRGGVANPQSVLAPQVLEVLASRRWPGNIRELRNVVERAMVFVDGGLPLFPDGDAPDDDAAAQCSAAAPESGPSAAPAASDQPASATVDPRAALEADAADFDRGWLARALPKGFLERPYKLAKEVLLEQFEVEYLRHLLREHGYNITHLASAARVDRHLIRKLLRKHALDR